MLIGADDGQAGTLVLDRAWQAGYAAAVAELTNREYRVVHHRVGWGAQNASRLFQRKPAALAFFERLLSPSDRWARADLVRLESRRVGEWQFEDEVDDRW